MDIVNDAELGFMAGTTADLGYCTGAVGVSLWTLACSTAGVEVICGGVITGRHQG